MGVLTSLFASIAELAIRFTRENRLRVAAFTLTDDDGRAPESPAADLVLFHGLGGDPWSTWYAAPKELWWPAYVAERFPNVRIILVYYATQVSLLDQASDVPTENRAARIYQALRPLGVGDRPVVFVAHSLGGLHAKSLMLDELKASVAPITSNMRKVVFVATPHKGAYLANIASLFSLAGADVRELKTTHLKNWASRLHDDFKTHILTDAGRKFEVIGCFEALPTYGAFVVSQDAAMEDMDNENAPLFTSQAPGDHLTSVKPLNPTNDVVVGHVGHALKSIVGTEAPPVVKDLRVDPHAELLRPQSPRYWRDGHWHQRPARTSRWRAGIGALCAVGMAVGCVSGTVATATEIGDLVSSGGGATALVGPSDAAVVLSSTDGGAPLDAGAMCPRGYSRHDTLGCVDQSGLEEDRRLQVSDVGGVCGEGASLPTTSAFASADVAPLQNEIAMSGDALRIWSSGQWHDVPGSTITQARYRCVYQGD